MKKAIASWLLLFLATLTVVLAAAPPVPVIPALVIVPLENTDYASVVGNSCCPNLNSLIAKGSLATQYYANTHPSIGNYFMLTTGQILTNDDGQTPSSFPVSVNNIAQQAELNGKTWHDYHETNGTYYVRHDPIAYFTNVNKANIVEFSPNFVNDMNAGTLRQYNFVVPNGCDDGHDCGVATADTWVGTNIVPFLNSPQFKAGGALIILFDESGGDNTNGGGRVYWTINSPQVKTGYQSTTLYQHQSTLRLSAEAMGITATNLAAAATAPDMVEFFGTTPPAVTVSVAPTSVTLQQGQTQQFTATVTGSTNTAVTWSLTGAGSLSSGGLYTAPASITAASTATVKATSAADTTKSATATVSLQAPPTALIVTSTTLPGGVVGNSYTVTLTASGGAPPYTWAVTAGSLPSSLSLASATGTISGTPSAAGTSAFTATVTDSTSTKASAPLSITVGSAPPPPPPASLFGMHAHGFCFGTTPWPTTLGIGTFRMWDEANSWADINVASGTYTWTNFDACLTTALSHGAQPIYVFGRTPQWASSNPGNTSCLYGSGQCAPPSDLAADGTGTDQDWKNFVSAVVARAAGKILLWEMWNEPLNPNGWTGTFAQLVRMQNDAALIIKAAIPAAQIISPGNSNFHGTGGGTPIANWLTSYWAAGGGTNSDIVGFHGYYSIYAGDLYGIQSTIRSAMSAAGQGSKPLWDTEGGWQNDTDLPSASGQAAFLGQYYLLHQAFKIPVFVWYAFDDTVIGTLWTSSGGLNQAGVAYGQVQQWMNGATMTKGCQPTNNVWACSFTRPTPAGYQALAVWDAVSTVTYTPATTFKQYRDLTGKVTLIPAGGTIQVGPLPLLLENMSVGPPPPPPPPPPKPNAPTGLRLIPEVNFAWTAATAGLDPNPVTGYNVYRATTSGGPYTKLALVGASVLTYTDLAVTPGVTYYYVVTSVDSIGAESAFSAQITIMPPISAGLHSAQLNWAASTSVVVGYDVYRSTTSGGPYSPLTMQPVAALTYTDSSVASNTTYFYVVTAVDSAGVESVYSNEATAVIPS